MIAAAASVFADQRSIFNAEKSCKRTMMQWFQLHNGQAAYTRYGWLHCQADRSRNEQEWVNVASASFIRKKIEDSL